jgi:hypothetical protein
MFRQLGAAEETALEHARSAACAAKKCVVVAND